MKRTAYVYDPLNKRHHREGHPENYRRLEETWNLLQIDGILNKLIQAPSLAAPLEAVLRVHSRGYVERLEAASLIGGGHLDADTYLTQDSYQTA
ncbi:MAG TPA: hypothetical protein VNK95_13440, partial [Caldilineaceae bacterium]|nr:hypothetical protein [Caldilineaceae bacterium]